MIYFDNAATTLQKPPEVKDAVILAMETLGNAGRGIHAPTLNASRMVYQTRKAMSELLHAESGERISFTSNATEALNTALLGLFEKGDHIISSVCEHNSVLRPLYFLEQQGIEHTLIDTDKNGMLNYGRLEEVLRKDTRAVVITHASNLTGNITDLNRIAEFTRKHGLLFVLDASQTAGNIPIDVQEAGIDVLCFTGHKGLMGPQGTGGMYVKPGVEVRPLKTGGSGVHSYEKNQPDKMPEKLEAGTLNNHGLAGLNAAVRAINKIGISEVRKREYNLNKRFVEGIKEIEGIRIYGNPDTGERTAVTAINLFDTDSGAVSEWLWEDYEICVRAGAHCAPLMHRALGTEEQGAVRFSFSCYNTEDEIDQGIQAVRSLAEQLKNR